MPGIFHQINKVNVSQFSPPAFFDRLTLMLSFDWTLFETLFAVHLVRLDTSESSLL